MKVRRKEAASGIARRSDDHRTSRIAEQHTSVAIAPIDKTAQKLGTDDENPLGFAGLYELVGDAQCIKRARGSSADIEGKGARRAELGLNDNRTGRQWHVGRDRGDDDHVEIFGSWGGLHKRAAR